MTKIDEIATNVFIKDGIWFSKNSSEISYPNEGNSNCFQIEDKSYWFKHRNDCIVESVKKYCSDKTFFDIGGGNGFVTQSLQNNGIDSVLIEPGINGALNAKKREIKNIICSTLEDAGIKDNQLKAVGLFDVIEHIEKDHLFLENINRLMCTGAHIFITVPAYNWLWSDDDDYAGHYRRYTLKSASKLLNSAGYNVIFKSYIFCLLPLPILLMRTIPSVLKLNQDPGDIQKQHNEHSSNKGLFKYLLEYTLKKELNRIRQSKSVLFGSSCFLIGQKK